jgi:hypothetical protein
MAGISGTAVRGAVAVGAAVAAVVATGLPAGAVTPEEAMTPRWRSLIDPRQVGGVTAVDRPYWRADGELDGVLPGRPGNRHETSVTLSRVYVEEEDPIRLTYRIEDLECAGDGTCSPLRTVSGVLDPPAGTTWTLGGAARVVVRVDDTTPGVSVVRAPGVPETPFSHSADVTITPVRPIPGLGLENVESAWRSRSVGVDDYRAVRSPGWAHGTAAGDLFGISLPQGSPAGGTIAGWGRSLSRTGPGLVPVRTAAERARWLPPATPGPGETVAVELERHGLLATVPVTSTGRRLPGDRHYLRVVLGQGTTLAEIDSRNCEAGAEWADCTPAERQVTLTVAGRPTLVRGADGRAAVTALFRVAPAADAGRNPQAWGTIRLSAVLAPGRVGVPQELAIYNRVNPGGAPRQFYGYRSLTYTAGHARASAPVSFVALGTAPVGPWRAGDTNHVAYWTIVSADAPAEPSCCGYP